MDDSTQDDECSIVTVTPPKKKKMKQARLPFQMLSSLESANKVPNKKRKLTSPLIECKSSKMIKITTKENSIENVDEAEVNGDVSNRVNESNSSVEILTDVEVEESIESKTSEDKEVQDNNETPKRSSRRSKRAKSKDNGTAGALTKFFKKTEKNLDIIGNHQNDSIQHKEIDEIQDKTLNVRAGDTVSESKNSQNEKREESNEMINDVSKCFDTDSDDTLSSSENEEKEEQEKSNTTMDNVRNATTSTPKTEDSLENAKRRKLTPKQLERRKESAKKREEKEKLRMEKEKKREEERENRRKEKEEKEKAEKEQKKKERELKELKKQMKIEQKQKEKEAKEEERRKKEEAKEEEKRKKEEEKQEVERKKQKAASNFASFFVAKKQESKCAEEENVIETRNFMPFEVKADMKVAPICRRVISDKEKSLLDERCHKGNAIRSELYIAEIKNKKFELRKSTKTWPLEAKDEVIVVDEENDDTSNIVDETHDTEKQRPKLLQFAENRRPPYWGTWRKQSSCVQSRRPFSKDTVSFHLLN
ncbi:hypothetical protein KM043_016164 [Ampulex compressa]|nr:hypothetical protein KM043_016164 [Ampulex compressa]